MNAYRRIRLSPDPSHPIFQAQPSSRTQVLVGASCTVLIESHRKYIKLRNSSQYTIRVHLLMITRDASNRAL